jgi:dienelactone hydrolase
MIHRSALLVSIVITLGCSGPVTTPSDAAVPDDVRPDVGIDGGPSCTVLLSHADSEIPMWPALELLVDDATTETGQRLEFDPAAYPTLGMRLAGYAGTLTDDLDEVDGFGVSAEAYFSFGRAFDTDMIAALPLDTSAGVGFVVLGTTPRFVPALASTTDEGATLMLAPLRPLPERARIAVFVTNALAAASRGCFESSEEMMARIGAPDAETQEAIDALVTVGAITAASDLIAINVYPTQTTTPDSVAVAADVASRTFAWATAPNCVDETTWTHCEGTFLAGDYREADGVFRRTVGAAAAPTHTYEIPVSIWLPPTGTGPFPVLVYGHGLTGARDQAERLAQFAAPHGIATVAIDANEHGHHPTVEVPGRPDLDTLFAFFGINLSMLSTRALEAARLRDNFRASTWDKLQLVSLLQSIPDVDGDGTADLDVDRFAYLGVSLGGIMGPELLALSPELSAGVLVVPGGRVSTIISDSATFGSLIALVRPRGTTDGDVRRFFPILQTILERGDAASYGEHILASRLTGTGAPQSVLLGVVLDDDTVPNVANYALARAFGELPIVETQLRPVPGLSAIAGPIMGNFADGSGGVVTGGLLQFDVVGDDMGGSEMATHGNVGDSDVGASAWLDFLDTHFAGGPARIRDPYVEVGLAHAAP